MAPHRGPAYGASGRGRAAWVLGASLVTPCQGHFALCIYTLPNVWLCKMTLKKKILKLKSKSHPVSFYTWSHKIQMMPNHLAKVTFIKRTHSWLHCNYTDFSFLLENRVLCVSEGHVIVLTALSTGGTQNSCKMWMILGIHEFSPWKEETFLSSFRHPLRRKEKPSV